LKIKVGGASIEHDTRRIVAAAEAAPETSFVLDALDWLESEVAEGDRGPKLALWRKDALFASTFATSREAWVSSALRARWQKFLSIN
jgi:hypothetical protein